ncbi:MAG: kinase, partial [Actinomycetota bacterium]|nr:kinase [Actinomycetota bacterium]
MSDREALLVTHTGRRTNTVHACAVAMQLIDAGFGIRVLAEEADELDIPDATVVSGPCAAEGVEIVLALGGDGTVLRAAELARPAGAPLLGINLGHVGFLTEAEVADLEFTVRSVVDRTYTVDERLTVDVDVHRDDDLSASSWALNEVSVEKGNRERMIQVLVSVDGRPLSRWGCDGVVCATPTGSTAYNFSAGGPIVWPEVEALLMVPISAHALFARPMVVGPSSVLAVEVLARTVGAGVLWCDGRRAVDLPPGARIEVRRGHAPVRLARLHEAPFTDRL